MGTKTVRIEDDVYELIRSKKREDETFSEAIERLVGGGSLLDLYGAGNEEDVENMREAIDETKEETRGQVDELRDRAQTE
ncbi:antitoxin VapB family protein [Halomicrococcus sp. NG-SE-24]|uniref:antitoxin VapB family protein n=1 Tax=Halomicrococcus sp. NG-SE-24 TaxID=3436928 RepID=UPI003D994962